MSWCGKHREFAREPGKIGCCRRLGRWRSASGYVQTVTADMPAREPVELRL